MNTFMFTPHDSIYTQLNQCLKLINDFKENQQILEVFLRSVKLSQNALPFLQQECGILNEEIQSLQNKIQHKLSVIQSYETTLKGHMNELMQHDKKINENTHKVDALLVDRKKLIQVLQGNEWLLQNKGDVHLARAGSKQASEYTGLGLDIIEGESHRIDTQANSIERKLSNKHKKAQELLDSKKELSHKALLEVSTLEPILNRLTEVLDRIKMRVKDISRHVNELEELTQLAQKNNLYRAALFGDVDEIKKYLFTLNSPSEADSFGYKPVYYACRGGHLQAALFLLDLTQLSKQELSVITSKLPTYDKSLYDALYAALKANSTSYDYLWNDQKSFGDNIIRVFLDYYEPEILPSLRVSKEFILSFWHRDNVKFAKDIVAIFSLFEDNLKQNQKICQDIINSKWQTFFNLDPDTTDTLARRLHYVKNKLEDRFEHELNKSEIKSLKSKLNNPSETGKKVGFLSFLKSPFGFMNQNVASAPKKTTNRIDDHRPKV